VGAPVTVQGAPVTIQGAPVYVQGAPVTVQGAPVTVQGAPMFVQGAPVTVQGAPVYVPGAPVFVQGATVTQVGQPVYVQGQPTYIQGTAVPVAPEIRFVPVVSQPTYARAAFGAASCPAGYSDITSATTCRAAQQYLNLPAGSPLSGSWAGYPSGCHYDKVARGSYPVGVYYNDISQGYIDSDAALLSSLNVNSQRYTRDSRGFCLDSQNNFQQVAPTFCAIRRSQRSVEASQAIPYVAALTVCGGIMVVVALVASVVLLARRTISKRLEMRFREHGLEMRS